MEPAQRSRTAEAAAFLRALHRQVDSAPWVFEDAAVEALLPLPGQHFLRRLSTLARPWISAFRQRRSGLDAMRAQIVVRARYAEDALFAQDPSQYLVLAAGLDTFALRHAGASVQVFEVDHPATQAWKRTRFEAPPENLIFVPVDFERTTLAEALTATEFDTKPTFVSWLGTTYYLTRDAIAATLRGVRERTNSRRHSAGPRLLERSADRGSTRHRAFGEYSARNRFPERADPIPVRACGDGSARLRDGLARTGAPRSSHSECAVFGASQRRSRRAELRLPPAIGAVNFF